MRLQIPSQIKKIVHRMHEMAGWCRPLLSNFTHEGVLERVVALQDGRADTARMVRSVA